MASDASALGNRHSHNDELRGESRKRIRDKYGVDPDNSEEEKMCADTERLIEKKFKKRKLERDEYNDMVGVENAGPSAPVSPMSDDSDHKQLMEDELEFINKKESEYRKENSHKSDYSEEDAQKYAKDCLDKLKDEYDNPDTDNTDTDNPETDHEHEGANEPDSDDESSNSKYGSNKGTNILTKIKDIFKNSGGSGGVSSGGSGDGGSNNNGGSDNDSSNFFTIPNFILLFSSIIKAIAESLDNLNL